MTRPWTTKELIYFEENYGKLSTPALSKKLNRSASSLYAKAKNLGLKKDYDAVEYAVYKGEKMLDMGTRREIKEKLGFDKKKLSVISSPSHRIRAENGENVTVAYRLDEIS
ncbi:hypothetical protein [Oceanobacillus alkalisoli]|uniref:hypothetical protein n=1 Tax=Oceanobacillus alkalisoli TaxID=2925113 RepID=UPI001EE40973|nr:hypothetical protein [Oceanobacillus alkalisoli]MCG5104420.1 hypothetical protein [Oceanobacillus alkalisoli]